MRKFIRSQSGFTFVETLISFSIVGIFLALTWATVNFLLIKTSDQIVRTRAHFLAVEGIELTRQIRQTAVNRNREDGFVNVIGSRSGSFVLTKNRDEFSLENGSFEQIEMNEEPYTTYCRTLFFEGEREDERIVTSEVRWGDPVDCSQGNERIAYSTYLANITQ